jgi:hypothetical protein
VRPGSARESLNGPPGAPPKKESPTPTERIRVKKIRARLSPILWPLIEPALSNGYSVREKVSEMPADAPAAAGAPLCLVADSGTRMWTRILLHGQKAGKYGVASGSRFERTAMRERLPTLLGGRHPVWDGCLAAGRSPVGSHPRFMNTHKTV